MGNIYEKIRERHLIASVAPALREGVGQLQTSVTTARICTLTQATWPQFGNLNSLKNITIETSFGCKISNAPHLAVAPRCLWIYFGSGYYM